MSKSCSTPIPKIGQIQSCGYILAVEEDAQCPSGMRMVGVSANIVEALWTPASSTDELVGKDLGLAFREESLDAVRSLVRRQKTAREPSGPACLTPKANTSTCNIYPFSADEGDGSSWTCTLVAADPGIYLLELEMKHGPHSASTCPRDGDLVQLASLFRRIPVGATPRTTTAAVCDVLLEHLSAFDRIMVYRFEPDGTGEITHESIRPGYNHESSYLNRRYPADDIPPMARELIKQKGVTFIADTSAKGVPIDVLPDRITTLNLSKSSLRASSEFHLGYLRNMGVKSSMVVAIIADANKLWGLYTCHSYTSPVHPSCEDRIFADLAATVASSLMGSEAAGGDGVESALKS